MKKGWSLFVISLLGISIISVFLIELLQSLFGIVMVFTTFTIIVLVTGLLLIIKQIRDGIKS